MIITNEMGQVRASQPDKPDRSDEENTAVKQEHPASRSGFKNDPDDPNNPNEVIERERQSVRELEKPQDQDDRTSDKS